MAPISRFLLPIVVLSACVAYPELRSVDLPPEQVSTPADPHTAVRGQCVERINDALKRYQADRSGSRTWDIVVKTMTAAAAGYATLAAIEIDDKYPIGGPTATIVSGSIATAAISIGSVIVSGAFSPSDYGSEAETLRTELDRTDALASADPSSEERKTLLKECAYGHAAFLTPPRMLPQ